MRVVGHVRICLIVLAVIAVSVAGWLGIPDGSLALQDDEGGDATVRIVHGIADAGPLDVYVDGSLALIGMVFTDTSGDLVLAGGDREFAVVPTGATPESAIASGTIALDQDSRSYATLLGTLESANVGLFAVDERPLDQGRARFRIISGVVDAGEIVPVFTGGDSLSEPLGFGDASQYAAVDAGTYDLSLLDPVTGAQLLSLPQTPFAGGTTTDLILVGQVSDGSLVALIQAIGVEAEVSRILGSSAQIFVGSCSGLEDPVADLGTVQIGQGEVVGSVGADPVAQGFGLAGIPFTSLVSSPHTVTVSEDGESGGEVVACGEIGGTLTDTGALVIALQATDSGAPAGVAVLAPALEDPGATGVSVFLTIGVSVANPEATPTAAIE
jgi:hypothetical protein